jgi:hypothetical protein
MSVHPRPVTLPDHAVRLRTRQLRCRLRNSFGFSRARDMRSPDERASSKSVARSRLPARQPRDARGRSPREALTKMKRKLSWGSADRSDHPPDVGIARSPKCPHELMPWLTNVWSRRWRLLCGLQLPLAWTCYSVAGPLRSTSANSAICLCAVHVPLRRTSAFEECCRALRVRRLRGAAGAANTGCGKRRIG